MISTNPALYYPFAAGQTKESKTFFLAKPILILVFHFLDEVVTWTLDSCFSPCILEFFEKLLDGKYNEASELSVKLKIILDGGEGYTSSFLNEAFRLLGEKYGADVVWNNLIIVSEERPKYIAKIKKSVYEMGK